MKLTRLMTLNATVATVFGLACVFVPARVLSYYGLAGDASLKYMTQFVGASFCGFGVITWVARRAGDSVARRAILSGLFVSLAICFVISLIAQLEGFMSPFGWSTVAISLILTLGFGYFRLVKPEAA